MRRDELIDFLLGELPEARAGKMRERLEREPELAREAAVYSDALGIVREAASEAEWAPATSHVLRFAARISLVAAALVLVAVGVFWMERGNGVSERVFEPEAAYGALLPEELGADGEVFLARRLTAPSREFPARRLTAPSREGTAYRLERGAASAAAIGARSVHALDLGDTILEESELSCGAEGGACISLPHGGLLFVRPLSTLQLRSRPDGHVALRLLSGTAATVVGDAPIHLAVDGTDLLLTQHSGAALLRHQESDAICLRGRLELHLEDGKLWPVPPGERLPAACARAPESEPYCAERLELEWYDALLGHRARHQTIQLDKNGVSEPIHSTGSTLLYVRAESRETGKLRITFGEGEGRTFKFVGGKPLELRVPLRTLGSGPRLRIEPAAAAQQVRIFEIE